MWSSPLSKPTGGLFSHLSNGCRGLPGSKVFGAQQVTTDLHLGRELKKTGALDVPPFTSFVAYVICGVEVCSDKERRNVNIGMVEQGSNSVVRPRRTA
jgi:hypothetical protein